MIQEAIVIGKNPSIILGQARALGQTGHIVHVLKTVESKPHTKPYELYSKYIRSYDYISIRNDKALMGLLLNNYANSNYKKVIIPCDDNAVSFLDRHCVELSPYFLFPNINYQNGSLSYYMNKAVQKTIAEKCGLNTPKGWTIEWVDGRYNIPEDIIFPCFVKPEVYHIKRKYLMKKCENRHEIEEVMKACPKDLPMLVEQFVDITQEYGVSGLSINGKVMVASLIKKIDTYLGTTASGFLYPISQYPELGSKIKKFMEQICYTGIFDVDLYESNGKVYFCECNLRLGNSGVATLLNGVNLPSILIDAFCGRAVNLTSPKFQSVFFVDERVYIQKYYRGEISWTQYKTTLRKASISYIFNDEDKVPYYVFIIRIRVKKFLRSIRKLFSNH